MAVVVGRFRLFWWTVARGILAFVLLIALDLAAVGMISVIGLPLALLGLVALRPLADLHRRRVEWLLGTRCLVPTSQRPSPLEKLTEYGRPVFLEPTAPRQINRTQHSDHFTDPRIHHALGS